MSDIERFFEDYARALVSLDPDEITQAYADDFLAAGPGFLAPAKNDADFRTNILRGAEFYRGLQATDANVVFLEEHGLDELHALAKVRWSFRREDGSEIVATDFSYVIREIDGVPKIVMFISHQDEQALFRERGLIPG